MIEEFVVESEIDKSKEIQSSDLKYRRIIAIFTWIVILFIPSYGKTETLTAGGHASISESIYLLPWLIVIRHLPASNYASDQYTIITFPWSFILFIPSLYILQQTFQIFKSGENKEQNAVYILIGAIIQWGLLSMTFRSQEVAVSERLTIILFPQILLILIYFFLSIKWYYEKVDNALKPTP